MWMRGCRGCGQRWYIVAKSPRHVQNGLHLPNHTYDIRTELGALCGIIVTLAVQAEAQRFQPARHVSKEFLRD